MEEQDSAPSLRAPVDVDEALHAVGTPEPAGDSSPHLQPTLLHRTRRKPMGLKNPSNTTCYLNSVVQCLTFTPPLAEYCVRAAHTTNCRRRRCTLCLLEKRIRRSLRGPMASDLPRNLIKHVVTESELFEDGREEDVHELMSFLIDDCGKGVEGRSVLEELLSGMLQSRIECKNCNAVSTRRESMLDLSLNICELGSLKGALHSFFRPEILNGANKYHCERCNGLSVARKRLSIYEMPKVLTIQLKRFDPLSENKLKHHVQFDDQLSVTNYISKKFTEGPVPSYKLYALIDHRGHSRDEGHYVAAVKDINGTWYRCDDDNVVEWKKEHVLESNAYLLLYIRSDVRLGGIHSDTQSDDYTKNYI